MELLSTNVSFEGEHRRYRHTSATLECDMEFAVYLPPVAVGSNPKNVPVLYWLSGLTCTWQNVNEKSGIQRHAAEHGMMVAFPDTSPRGEGVPEDVDRQDDRDQGGGGGEARRAGRGARRRARRARR